jgi:hypothetical protein
MRRKERGRWTLTARDQPPGFFPAGNERMNNSCRGQHQRPKQTHDNDRDGFTQKRFHIKSLMSTGLVWINTPLVQ